MALIPHRRHRVTIVRWVDGNRLERIEERGSDGRWGLTADEVVTLKLTEQCLPGDLAHFEATPLPRPWEHPSAGQTTELQSDP